VAARTTAAAFTGQLVKTPLTGIVNHDRLRLLASFTPDSKSVVCGRPERAGLHLVFCHVDVG